MHEGWIFLTSKLSQNFVKIDEAGKLVSVGSGDGSTSILQVDENLMSNSKLDRTNASDMFERFSIDIF